MRVKIILPNFIAVLILGLGGFFYVQRDLRQKGIERLTKQMETTRALYERSEGLHGFELLNDVRTHAMTKGVVEAFAPVELKAEEGQTQAQVDKKIRAEWFKKCVRAVEVYTEIWAEKTGKRPELVFLTDRNGVIIARNITPNACPAGYNVSKVMPVMARALDGQASYGIWSIDDSPFSSKKTNPDFCALMNTGLVELAAAPVWYQDDIAGVLVIGFEISNGTAQKKAEMLGLDVAVLTGGDVYSSSLKTDTARQSLEKQLDRPEIAKRIDAAATSGKPSDVFEILVEDVPYLALITPVMSAEKKDRVVTIMMGSVDSVFADFKSISAILVLMIAMLLVVFIGGLILTHHFIRPIVTIEEGLLKVINGEYQYRFEVESSEVGGLGYRINQLIGVLTGEEEDSEE
ncbi:MAG: hypothetical protein QNJ97_04985 [Myxococcota bacterium]|nr:hypothetical protein [Myxococcota bacterium]